MEEINKVSGSTKNKKISEKSFKLIFLFSAVFSIIAVISIFVFIFLRGIPAISKTGLFKFIFGTEWHPNKNDVFNEPLAGSYGILTMIVGTLYSTIGALLIGGTLGFFTAVYLAKFCPKKIKGVLSQIVNLLAGIPSVIYGFFGITVILPLLGNFSPNGDGSGILAVSLILGIMIMPTVAALSKTSIEAVDNSYFEGAIALGATKEQAIFKTVVPAAKSGIFASLILGVGRAIGETMAVVMIAGNNTVFPKTLFSSFRTMTGNIVFEMSYAGEFQMGALIATGVVLFGFILIINVAFNLLKKGERKTRKQTVTGGIIVEAEKSKKNNKSSKLKILQDAQIFTNETKQTKQNFLTGKGSVIGKYISYVTTAIGILSLISIVLFIIINGLPYINMHFLFGEYTLDGAPSIFSSIISTLMLILLTSLIAFPIGIFTAIYLVEYTKKGSRFVKIIRIAVETLGGIPSIVYGLFGMIFFCGILGFGTSILAGCFTIALMIIPTTVRATEEALKAVPDSYREGSYALGGGKLRTIYKIVIPSALPGILAAVILGVGRVVSESAPVLFTMGASPKAMPNSYKSSGASLSVALYYFCREGLYINEAYATACVLIFIVLSLNILSTFLVRKLQRKLNGNIGKVNDIKKIKSKGAIYGR